MRAGLPPRWEGMLASQQRPRQTCYALINTMTYGDSFHCSLLHVRETTLSVPLQVATLDECSQRLRKRAADDEMLGGM